MSSKALTRSGKLPRTSSSFIETDEAGSVGGTAAMLVGIFFLGTTTLLKTATGNEKS